MPAANWHAVPEEQLSSEGHLVNMVNENDYDDNIFINLETDESFEDAMIKSHEDALKESREDYPEDWFDDVFEEHVEEMEVGKDEEEEEDDSVEALRQKIIKLNLTPAKIRKMKAADLRDLCAGCRLETKGAKVLLAARLQHFAEGGEVFTNPIQNKGTILLGYVQLSKVDLHFF